MINRDEIDRSLTGAWKIFLDRPDAMQHFDTGYSGFWRSFQAILLVAPLYAITVFGGWRSLAASPLLATELINATAFFWARALALGIDWITLPILLALLAKPLGFSGTYAPYIVARNWSTVLIATPFALIGALEIVIGSTGLLVQILVLGAALRFSYMVVKRALAVTPAMAASIVTLDFFLSIFISVSVNLMLGLSAAA
jgi:hypothetical protein